MCLSKKKPGLNLAFSWMKQISGEEYKTRLLHDLVFLVFANTELQSAWMTKHILYFRKSESPNNYNHIIGGGHMSVLVCKAAIRAHVTVSLSSTLCVRTACSFSLGNQCCFCAIVSIKTVLPALLIFQSCCSKKDAHSGCIFLSKTQIVPHPGISSVSIFYLSNPNST